MGDNNSIRQGTSWTGYGRLFVRQGTSWLTVNRAWVRQSPEWKLYTTVDQPPKIDEVEAVVCAGSSTGGACDTQSGCAQAGQVYRIRWNYTGSKSGHHMNLHRSDGGGSYVSVADNLQLDQADPDAGCCDNDAIKSGCIGSSPKTGPDGIHVHFVGHDSGSSISYAYRGRIELDGTDTLVGSAVDQCNNAESGWDTTSCII
jgi:hypothetical protein